MNDCYYWYKNDNLITAFDYYSNDIDKLSDISLEEKNALFLEVYSIINKLNKLFDSVGNITMFDDIKKKSWISDKVDFCIWICDDKEIVKEIKKLYNEYVIKRNILVEANLKFVILVARSCHFKDNVVSFEDFLQYGNMGLIRAIETYNPNNDVNFLTYAKYWIKQCIMLNSKQMMYQMKIPMHVFELNNKRLSAINNLIIELGRFPTDSEVASYMEITIDKLNILSDTFRDMLSLDDFSGIYLDGLEVPIIELVSDDMVDLEKNISKEYLLEKINEYMYRYLNERERFILRNIYGFDNEISCLELSKQLGISSQRVSQIKNNALEKLCGKIKVKEMKLYLR